MHDEFVWTLHSLAVSILAAHSFSRNYTVSASMQGEERDGRFL